MPKTIQTVLSPLLIIALFYGLNFFEYPFGRARLYFFCAYFLITWSLYAYLFYYLIRISYTSYLYLSTTDTIAKFIAIVSILAILFNVKKFKMCLQLSIVDDTLEILVMSKEYQQLHNWVIRIIMEWIVLTFLMNISDSVWLNYEYFSIVRIGVPFVVNHLEHVNIFILLTWSVMLGNTIIEVGQAIDNLSIFIFGIINSMIFLTINYICQTLCDKANKTIAILYKLSNNNSDKDCEQILQFILQIKQREMKISGMGLFYFGYDFIRKFYVSVTVLVIIIQMRLLNPHHYIPPTNYKS